MLPVTAYGEPERLTLWSFQPFPVCVRCFRFVPELALAALDDHVAVLLVGFHAGPGTVAAKQPELGLRRGRSL